MLRRFRGHADYATGGDRPDPGPRLDPRRVPRPLRPRRRTPRGRRRPRPGYRHRRDGRRSPARDKILAYLRTGIDEGARLVTQGTLPADERLKDGYRVPPTVLADVTPSMTLAQEEIFGPDRLCHAIHRRTRRDQNLQRHGVRADRRSMHHRRGPGVPDSAASRGRHGVRQQLHAPRVPRSPFGGQKGNGFGRENAIETLHEFVRSKNIRFPSGRGVIPT
jgi:hypothetical protein